MAVRLAALSLRCSGRRCVWSALKPSLPAVGVCSPGADRAVALRPYASEAAVGKAGTHWKMERVVAVGLLGLIPAGLIYPGVAVDYGLAVLVPLHGHWGFQSVVEDYFPESTKRFGNILVYAMSFGAFAGLMYLNLKDVGICGAIRMIWSF